MQSCDEDLSILSYRLSSAPARQKQRNPAVPPCFATRTPVNVEDRLRRLSGAPSLRPKGLHRIDHTVPRSRRRRHPHQRRALAW